MDTDKRQKIFPTDIGLEPKVVVSAEPSVILGGDSGEWERVALDAKQRAELDDKAASDRAASAERAGSDAFVLGETAAKLKAIATKKASGIAVADTPPAGLPVVKPDEPAAGVDAPKAAAQPEPAAAQPEPPTPAAQPEPATAAAQPEPATAAAQPEPAPAQPEPSAQPAPATAAAQPEPAAQPALGVEPAIATQAATAKPAPVDAGHTRSKIASLPARPPGADEIDPATAALVAIPQYLGEMKSDPHAAVTAFPATSSEPRAHRAGVTDAKDLVRALVAEAMPPDPAAPQPTSGNGASGPSAAVTVPVRAIEETVTTPFNKATLDETGRTFVKSLADDSLAFLRPQPKDETTDDTGSVPVVTPTDDSGVKPFVTPTDDSGGKPFIKPTAEEVAAPSGDSLVAKPVAAPSGDNLVAKPGRARTTDDRGRSNALIAEPITVSEAARTSIAVADVVTVRDSGEIAVVTAKPATLISERPATSDVASLEPARTLVRRDTPPAMSTVDRAAQPARGNAAGAAASRATADATPEPAEDEPSDGVVRAMIATADTARLARAARMRQPSPEHDGPPIKETTGEIRERPRSDTREPPVVEPSILIEGSQPSILVADLAAAHDAIAAVTAKAVIAVAPPDAASPSRELEVSDVRRDAVAFSDAEEAFFSAAEKSAPVARVHHDSFDDLDEGYQPPKFWDRVFGRKPKKP
jgi:hypothetical protein